MQLYQTRVVEESNELRSRLSKLTTFISENETFKTMDAHDQDLLRCQRDAMADYLDVLGKRIRRFAVSTGN